MPYSGVEIRISNRIGFLRRAKLARQEPTIRFECRENQAAGGLEGVLRPPPNGAQGTNEIFKENQYQNRIRNKEI